MADKFQMEDRVFAKIKGWPPWPAKILNRVEGKIESYRIQFYGTYDTSVVKPDNIFIYNDESKAKYGKPKNNNRWKEAMDEIEKNTLIGDNGPVDEEGQVQEEEEPIAPKVEVDADTDGDGDGELMIDEGPPSLTKEVNIKPVVTPGQNGKPEQPKGRRGSKASLSKRDSISSVSSATEVATPTASNAPPATELVSRSGRKIKPKRFADDEIQLTPTPAKTKSSGSLDDSLEPPSKRSKRGGKTPPSVKTTPVPVAVEAKEAPVRPRMVIGKGKGAPGKPPIPASGRISPDISSPIPRAPALKPASAAAGLQRRPEVVPGLAPTRKPLPALIPASGAAVAATRAALPPARRAPSLRQQSASLEKEEFEDEIEDDDAPLMHGDEAEADDKENVKDAATSSNGSEVGSESEGKTELDEAHIEAYDESLSKIAFTDKEGDQYELRFENKEEFEGEEERAEYDESVNSMLKLKDELEQGDGESHETLQELMEATRDDFDPEESSQREHRAIQIRTLRIEGEVIEIIGEIISCLGEKQAECYRALELLERLGSHELTPLILKKHPEVVQTVAKLRNYVGNVGEWSMADEDETEFKDNATSIRVKAAEIYANFYNIFVPIEEQEESVTFEEIFTEEMKAFNEMTKDLTQSEVLGLTGEGDEGFDMFDYDSET